MEKFLMGIDNGGTLTKAALYTIDGKEVASATRKTTMLMPEPYHTERAMDELWEANCSVIQTVLAKAEIDASQIAAISLTGHGNGVYITDQHGVPTYNGIISTDSRAKAYIESWYQDPAFETEVLPKTMQSVWTGQPVALLAWLKEKKREVYDATAFIFMVKDYVRFKLSGEAYLEITDASGTSLLNVRDRCYDADLLAFFGIAEVMEKLPPLKESTDVCGYVSKEAAEATGLTVGTPIAGGIFDISASAVASGLVEEGTLCIVAGTWSINEFITKKPVVDHALFMTSIYCLPDYWLTTEASPTSASNLEWFIDQFMELEKREAEAGGRSVYELCNEMVAQTTPEESDLLFFPFLFGSNTVAHANAGFIGMNSWHQKKHVVRAVYEGIVFSHLVHIERLLRYGEKPKRCRIAGGVTKSAVWVQMFADCLKLPIEIVEVNEHGTLGTAMCAAVMQGYYSSMKDAAEAMVQVGRTIVPNQEQSSIYATKFQRYKDRLKQMEPIWKAGV